MVAGRVGPAARGALIPLAIAAVGLGALALPPVGRALRRVLGIEDEVSDVAVPEVARVVRPGGSVAAYVWDYAEGMAFLRRFRDAAIVVDPAPAALDEGGRFPVCRPGPLRALWTEAGLVDVVVVRIEVSTVFADFADFADPWEPFPAGQGPAPGYVSALAPPTRERLRDTLRETVATRPDGSIPLTARAWAVRGRRPAPAVT